MKNNEKQVSRYIRKNRVFKGNTQKHAVFCFTNSGAGYEARTRYLHLGKVALYQMS